MAKIHPTAVVDAAARLADTVEIGPFCVVGPEVVLGEGVQLLSHVVVAGHTNIGDGTRIWPFASIGHQPQDLKYKGEPSRLEIGRNNLIREHVTINPGTEGGGMVTRIGDGGLFMMASHVAHDCQVGDGVILANNATLAGHVSVGDYAVLGGLCAVHQFVRIGRMAMIGGMSGVENDVIPFGVVMGNRATLSGLNLIGLKRRNVGRDEIHAVRNAFKLMFEGAEGTFLERVEAASRQYPDSATVKEVVEFIRVDTSRAICQPRPEPAPAVNAT